MTAREQYHPGPVEFYLMKERAVNYVRDIWASIPLVQNHRDKRFKSRLLQRAMGFHD